MINKPTTAAGYAPEMVTLVRSTCLYLGTKLGDLMDEIVVVGGLVPSLLIDQSNSPADTGPHAGTMDLDLAIAFALVNGERYAEVTECLVSAGVKPDLNAEGQPSRQGWCINDHQGTGSPSNRMKNWGTSGSKTSDCPGVDDAFITRPAEDQEFADRSELPIATKL